MESGFLTGAKGSTGRMAKAGDSARSAFGLLVFAGFLAVSACTPTIEVPGPYGEKKPFAPTEAEQQALVNLGHARAINYYCPAEFQLNKPYRDSLLQPFAERAAQSGVRRANPEDLLGMSREETRAVGLAYEKQRGIITSRPETWCAAGRYEMSNNTSVGKFLLKVGK